MENEMFYKFREKAEISLQELYLGSNTNVNSNRIISITKYIDILNKKLEESYKIKSINQLSKEVHQNAIEHGWWDEERSFGEVIALCHSELSEALEAYRNNEKNFWMNGDKPDGIGVELADCVIRIMDYCGHMGIDLEKMIETKHEYNKTRSYKHGGKKI